MGRRSLISVSAISRLMASSRAEERRREADAIIANNRSLQKELPPTYSLDDVDFNEQNRIAKLSFQKTVNYRTVDRYIQKNYERYPIYSGWKTKRSFIKKSIKLTNTELEKLNYNADDLIREFAFEIITWLKNPDLTPSWFYKQCIEEEFRQKNLKQNKIESDAYKEHEKLVSITKKKIAEKTEKVKVLKKENSILQNKIDKLSKKIEKTQNHKKNLFLSIITFAIYHYFGSSFRLNKLSEKLKIKTNNHLLNEENIFNLNKQCEDYEKTIKQSQENLQKIKSNVLVALQNNETEKTLKLQEIVPLSADFQIETNAGFIPLKDINGIEYKKIVGCYIIRNRSNQRCYVGQSKDVIKRLKQHFKGTYPNNIIFAEDYFAAKDKENLFEIKVYPCATKDELDKTEKSLIEEYDSFLHGYNGTSGNA